MLSESYRRGVAERKEWMKTHPGATWADATAAYGSKRLAETAAQRTSPASDERFNQLLDTVHTTTVHLPAPVAEAAAVAPVEPTTPLHEMPVEDFRAHAAQHLADIVAPAETRRGASPFFTDWDSASVFTGGTR